MAKVVRITVEFKQGLPNYSGRTASFDIVADENESLDVVTQISAGLSLIRDGFERKSASTPTSPDKSPAPAATVNAVEKAKGSERVSKKAKELAEKAKLDLDAGIED